MHTDLLSPYQHRTSAIHRLPPSVRTGAAVGFVAAIVLLPRAAWAAHALVGAALLGIAALSSVSLLRLGKRLLLVEPFAVSVALLSLFQRNGFEVFLGMLAKSTLCLFCMILLTATTRFSDLLRVLWQVRVPVLLVTTLALMHRYLFLLFGEMGRMGRARRSRTFTRDRWAAWRASTNLLGHLFVRTSERAERVYSAMCARGFRT